MVPLNPPVGVPPECVGDGLWKLPDGSLPVDPPIGALTGPPPVPAPGCEGDGSSVVRVVVGTVAPVLVGPDG